MKDSTGLPTRNHRSLVALLEGWCAKVSSSEVVVRSSPFFAVFLQGCLIFGESCLLELEWVLSSSHVVERGARRGLESFFRLEVWLEVQPVLVSVAEFYLYQVVLGFFELELTL